MKNNYYASATPDSSAYGAGHVPPVGGGYGSNYYPADGAMPVAPQQVNPVGGGSDFDIMRLVKRLYRHWIILLVLWAAFTSINLLGESQKSLTYHSVGMLSLGEDQGRGSSAAMGLMGGGPVNLYTQQLILRSKDLASEVIRTNGLNAVLSAPEPSVQKKIAYRPKFWQWEWAKWNGQAKVESYDSGLRVSNSNTNPNVYQWVSYRIVFTDSQTFSVKDGTGMERATGRLNELVRTPAASFVLEAAADCVMNKDDAVNINIGPDTAYVGKFLGSLGVQPLGNMQQVSNLIQISYASDSPALAKQVVESTMLLYLAKSRDAARQNASAIYQHVTKLMDEVGGKLQKETKALEEEQKRIKAFTLDPIVAKQVGSVVKTEAKLFELNRLLPRLQAAGDKIKAADALAGDDRALIELAEMSSPAVRAAIEEYRQTQRRLLQYGRTFTAEHALLTGAKAEVIKSWEGLSAIVQAQAVELAAELKRTEDELKKNQAAFDSLPESQRLMAGLVRNVQVLQANYDSLLVEKTRADIINKTTNSNYSIQDHASQPFGPSAPTIGQAFSSSLGLSFMLAALLVMLPGLRIRWFETAEEAMKAVRQPVFGVLPFTGQRSRRGERKILVEDPNSRWAESMRLLRTNLLQAMAGKPAQVVMISGAQPGDGKSTVAANLAVSLAQSARIKSVLLIDADMHRPSLHGVFGVPQSPGLSDYLNGTASIEDVIHQVAVPGVEGRTLAFIPAGPIPPVPSDLVETEAMQALMAYAREQHTFTVLDTPPYPLVSVAGSLSEHVDRVLTVCRIGRTARGLYLRHVMHLARHGANIGQIFNSPNAGRRGSAQDGYGYGYGYGEGYGKTYGKGYGAQEKKQQAEADK